MRNATDKLWEACPFIETSTAVFVYLRPPKHDAESAVEEMRYSEVFSDG